MNQPRQITRTEITFTQPTEKLQKVTPNKLAQLERTDKLIDGLKQGKTISALATELNVERMTLYRDFDNWLKTNGPADLYAEWLHDYNIAKKQSPVKALESLTRLLCKILEKEAKVEVNVTNQTAIAVSTNETSELLKRYEFLFTHATQTSAVQQDGASQ